jgi:hypothetical protein
MFISLSESETTPPLPIIIGVTEENAFPSFTVQEYNGLRNTRLSTQGKEPLRNLFRFSVAENIPSESNSIYLVHHVVYLTKNIKQYQIKV